jgi:hypothetical protein
MSININDFELVANFVVILAALLSIVYTFGVVWRVEKKLDVSYKLLLLSIVFFTLSEIMGFFDIGTAGKVRFWMVLTKVLFALFFLSGILTARRMIREVDGEK